jgi:hypothetical protein
MASNADRADTSVRALEASTVADLARLPLPVAE